MNIFRSMSQAIETRISNSQAYAMGALAAEDGEEINMLALSEYDPEWMRGYTDTLRKMV